MSVSRILSDRIRAVHIDLAELVKRERLFLGFNEVRWVFIADLKKLSKRVEGISRNIEGDIVVDLTQTLMRKPAMATFSIRL